MAGQPLGDGFLAVDGQLAIDVGVQFILGHW